MKCPAFALVTRVLDNKKEAMLVIRGSQSTMDWSINFEESVLDFEYNYITSEGVVSVQGKVHKGIYQVYTYIL